MYSIACAVVGDAKPRSLRHEHQQRRKKVFKKRKLKPTGRVGTKLKIKTMKKGCVSLIKCFCFSSLFFLTSSCKKEATPEPSTYFSFTYNGERHTFGEHNVGPYGGSLGPEQVWIAR